MGRTQGYCGLRGMQALLEPSLNLLQPYILVGTQLLRQRY